MLTTLDFDQFTDLADLTIEAPFHSRKVMGRAQRLHIGVDATEHIDGAVRDAQPAAAELVRGEA